MGVKILVGGRAVAGTVVKVGARVISGTLVKVRADVPSVVGVGVASVQASRAVRMTGGGATSSFGTLVSCGSGFRRVLIMSLTPVLSAQGLSAFRTYWKFPLSTPTAK